MIPDELVQRIRDAADIVQIIGEYVPLKRTGADYRGPCPFHQGTHRNFSVSPRKGIYYCFVCHEGGDVFNFLQKRLGMDWPSAVREVAGKVGIEVRETDQRREGPDPREPLWEVLAAAAAYFQRMLWEEDAGAAARAYLETRRLSRETAERFELGFAPRDAGLLRGYLGSLGFDDERMLAAGLLVRPDEERAELRPRFRARLTFPILDIAGRHVGFGGRLLGPGEPKYLNSPESTVFSKGKLLYALNWARNAIRRDERLLLVEGYFDVVRLMAAGVESVVAPLGTALTEEQARIVARYSKNVFLLYDSDKAGLKATFRAGDVLLAQGVAVHVVTLPEGEDPDTFVDKGGRQALEARLGDALDLFERKVQLLERAGWFGDLGRKRRAIDRLLPTIRATQDAVTRDLYVARASEASGVSKEVLLRELAAVPARGPARRADTEAPPPVDRAEDRRNVPDDRRVGDRRRGPRKRADPAERALVMVALSYPAQAESIAERLGAGDLHFRDRRLREIFSALLARGGDPDPERLAGRLSDEAARLLQPLLDTGRGLTNPQKTVDDSIAWLRIRTIEAEQAEIDAQLAIASDEEKSRLMRRKTTLQDEKRALGGIGSRWFKRRAL
ncbi:MAG TPA: DNA primase [Gemmatimonadaceae bacterium]|nr:DNA primase [Gemmatimonadaceae bacterium]